MGQDVRLKAPEHIKPVVERQNNDAVDAEAIAKAASRPTMEVFTVPLHLPCG
jgi:transposase